MYTFACTIHIDITVQQILPTVSISVTRLSLISQTAIMSRYNYKAHHLYLALFLHRVGVTTPVAHRYIELAGEEPAG